MQRITNNWYHPCRFACRLHPLAPLTPLEEKVLFGNKECLGEAFLAFKDIPQCNDNQTSHKINLTFTRIHGEGKPLN